MPDPVSSLGEVTLPLSLRRFWYEAAALNPIARHTGWGVVVGDSRVPRVWDANHAAVLEEDPGLTLDEIRATLRPVLAETGAPVEHVEFWAASMDAPAIHSLRAMRAGSTDVLMVFRGGDPPASGAGPEVREATGADEAFWQWYRESRVELSDPGEALPEEVVRQLVWRDRRVFLPAGARYFVGFVDGEMAGSASMLSLSGVAYLDNVVTVARFRRRGVATACVASAVAAAVEAGDDTVHLLAEASGTARRLYERLGFKATAEVVSFTAPLADHR